MELPKKESLTIEFKSDVNPYPFSEKNYFLNKWRVFLPFPGMKKDCCIRF